MGLAIGPSKIYFANFLAVSKTQSCALRVSRSLENKCISYLYIQIPKLKLYFEFQRDNMI